MIAARNRDQERAGQRREGRQRGGESCQRARPFAPGAMHEGHDGAEGGDGREDGAERRDHRGAGRQVPGIRRREPEHADRETDGPADDESAADGVADERARDRRHDEVREHEEHAGDPHRAGHHDAEREVEDEVPRAWRSDAAAERQLEQISAAVAKGQIQRPSTIPIASRTSAARKSGRQFCSAP